MRVLVLLLVVAGAAWATFAGLGTVALITLGAAAVIAAGGLRRRRWSRL